NRPSHIRLERSGFAGRSTGAFGKRESGVELMTDRTQERTALALFLESVRSMRSSDLVVQRDAPADFPDFVLLDKASGQEVWVEIVEAVESGELIAAGRRAPGGLGVTSPADPPRRGRGGLTG